MHPPMPAGAHQGVPFVPDPIYENIANQYQPQFISYLDQSRFAKNENLNPVDMKMMRDGREWDPVESLRNTPVNFGSLFDVRIAVGKAFRIEKEEGKKGRRCLKGLEEYSA